MRLIIHAGFHKTGTSTVQKALAARRDALAEHVALAFRDDIPLMVQAARQFSILREAEGLALFRECCLEFFREQDGTRPLLIATEDICGVMPGRAEVTSYSAVPELMQTLENAAREVFPDLDLMLYFSTRSAEPWIESLWWQHLRSTRITLSLEDYRPQAEEGARLDAIVSAVKDRVRCAVLSMPLETLKDLPEGPLTPLYDLLNLPEALRQPAPKAANTRPEAGLEPVFLALNRSGLLDKVISKTKQDLLRAARRKTG